MLMVRLSRPSLLGVVAGLLVPSRGFIHGGFFRTSLRYLSVPPPPPPEHPVDGRDNDSASSAAASRAKQNQMYSRAIAAAPRGTCRARDNDGEDPEPSATDGDDGEGSPVAPKGGERYRERRGTADGGGGRGAGGSSVTPNGEGRCREQRGLAGRGGGGRGGGRRRVGSAPVPLHKKLQQQQEQQQQRRKHRVGGPVGESGVEDAMSPEEEERQARALEVAVELAAAKRGTGERGRLVESEAPVEEYLVRGRRVLVKRDDMMRLAGSGLSGNKARKLYSLNKMPSDSFPKLVASHGGIQSNAMVAIAAVVASKKGSSFVYYTKPVPRWLRRNPVGNFARTMALGAEIMEVHPDDYKRVFGGVDGPGARHKEVVPDDALFLPQGGADAAAEEGVTMLADEIIDYWTANGPPGKVLKVIVPAGTGTTALFLARRLVPAGIAVCTVPNAGDGGYLLRQMTKVDRASGGVRIFPEIVEGSKKPAFGVPRREILEVWRELDGVGLFVDLLYAAPTWEVIMESWEQTGSPLSVKPGSADDAEPQLMYVHCGGLEGVSSQLTRYKHQGLVEDRQLQ